MLKQVRIEKFWRLIENWPWPEKPIETYDFIDEINENIEEYATYEEIEMDIETHKAEFAFLLNNFCPDHYPKKG